MAVQTTYPESIAGLRAGQIVEFSANFNPISRTVEGAAIGFGEPVVQGTADRGVRAPTTGDTAILGVTVREVSTTDDEFPVGDEARIAQGGGVIAVTTSVAVDAGDPVHVIVATGEFSNTGGVVLAGARYEDSAAADTLVAIRL